ncbi:Fused MFS/spermidine synthase [uncultured Gammaproteobacteria bacterium]
MTATLIPLYSITLLLSSGLLFLVQPMFGRMVLPLLGGVPAVWITAMLFFQTALLAGYGYAYVSNRHLTPRVQAVLHGLLLVGCLALILPLQKPVGDHDLTETAPVVWLLRTLAVTVGAPFVVLSATAPLVQGWFAASRHSRAGSPYFLYAVSNVGSIAALLGYPLLIEPELTLAGQSWLWSLGFAVLTGLIALVAAFGLGQTGSATTTTTDSPISATTIDSSRNHEARPDWRHRLLWLGLAAAPSSLMLGLTTYISTDIAAIPLIWVVPLALYLLTFINAFARRPLISLGVANWLQPFPVVILALIYGAFGIRVSGILHLALPVHLVAFWVTALVCHGRLAALKPEPRHLTEFYLWISVGGAIGGLFNAVIAPGLFWGVWEYPLALGLACALRPGLVESDGPNIESNTGTRHLGWGLAAVIVALTMAAEWLKSGAEASQTPVWMLLGIYGLTGLLLFALRRTPIMFGFSLCLMLLAGSLVPSSDAVRLVERNFFGLLKVVDRVDAGIRTLQHGTTLHGAQSLDPQLRRIPLTYFSRLGGLGDVFAELDRRQQPSETQAVGVIGLGAGSLACYGGPARRLTFFEIDPAVIAVARNPALFHFLDDCGGETVLGDGRLSLTGRRGQEFEALVVDAFSSDSIPVHLLTLEAFQLYFDKLTATGVLALHLSNRYLDLEPVIAAAAQALGATALIRESKGGTLPGTTLPYTASIVAVIARSPIGLGQLATQPGWRPVKPRTGLRPWTDDYSNLIQILRRTRPAY